ncbi:MAG TPA: glycosyltransferase, partial [Candidatus Binatia bacterium]|nr:glycosyltransferase [Candidatus Binatia bacterium]
MLRLAHLAQEDSRLPATRETVGSLTRVVHELTSRLALRWPTVVYSARHEKTDRAEEQLEGIRYVRFFPEPDRTLGAGWFRWRNRVARRLGVAEVPYPRSAAYYWTYIRRVARHVAVTHPEVIHFHNVSQFTGPLRRAAPHAALVLQMHCEWLVELPPAEVAARLADVDLVLGVSEHIVRQIRTAYPEVAARCRALHNGVDTARFVPRDAVRTAHGPALDALRARLGVRG